VGSRRHTVFLDRSIANLVNGKDRDTKLLVNHQSEDTHLGGTSVVQFDGTLLHLDLRFEGVPAVVDGSVTEVTNELSSGDVLHDGDLQSANEKEHLDKASSRDGGEGSESSGDGLKAGARVVNVTSKADSTLSGEVSSDGKHADASVLELDETQAVELGLVTVGDKAKGIPESKRNLGTELVFEGHVGGNRSAAGLGRGKGGGTGEEGSEDSELHGVFSCN
jgi:hypothetical protein